MNPPRGFFQCSSVELIFALAVVICLVVLIYDPSECRPSGTQSETAQLQTVQKHAPQEALCRENFESVVLWLNVVTACGMQHRWRQTQRGVDQNKRVRWNEAEKEITISSSNI